MSETWADAQFDMLEAAYDEVSIEAKARIAELERMLEAKSLRIVMDENAISARDELIRDLWIAITWMHGMSDAKRDELRKRLEEFGIEVDV